MSTLTVGTGASTLTIGGDAATLTVETTETTIELLTEVPVASLMLIADWHTTDAWPTRPSTSGIVRWVGPASAGQPGAMATYDEWRCTPT